MSKGTASGIPASGPGHGGPARGYSWEPFRAGNEVRLRHGARSERRVDPVAAELVEALLADRPDLAAYPEAVWGWARAEARCLLFADWHAEVGFLTDDGQVLGGGRVREYEVLAANLRARLGLDPVSDVQLQKARAEAVHLVVDLEGVRERGRAVLERRHAELVADDDVTEGTADAG